MEKRHHGFHRGIVKENKDPQNQRRLKVSVPQITGIEKTEWVWPMEPAHISVDAPVIGQGVWITYLNGDPEYPVWNGTYGKNQGKNKRILIKPLADSVSLTGLTTHVITIKQPDGTTEVDLISTIVALANKVKSLETRMTTAEGKITVAEGKITTLQGKVSTLETQMTGKAATNHTHP